MKVKELIDRLAKCDPEKIIKLTVSSMNKEKLIGLSHSEINVLVEIQDELWLVDETGIEWLDSMNWQDYYK